MSALPPSSDPAVVAVCLDWLHETLPWPAAPTWTSQAASGFATPIGRESAQAWRDCEQCGGKGETRQGRCGNCNGAGGWHFDPMDERRAALRTSADAHPERDAPLRTVKLSSALDAETERHADEYPPTLRALADALEALRERDRYQRAVLQRVHVIRLDPLPWLRPAERELYDAALLHLSSLLPPAFRAPRWAREKALARYSHPKAM